MTLYVGRTISIWIRIGYRGKKSIASIAKNLASIAFKNNNAKNTKKAQSAQRG